LIEGDQGCCGIGAAPAESAPHGQGFVQAEFHARFDLVYLLQLFGGAITEVLLFWDPGEGVGDDDFLIPAQLEIEYVLPVDKLKYGLQFVVTILTPANDAQHQIEFCWGWIAKAIW
jgi:hypothetical protein